jgi:hypothetical protein
MKPVRRLMERLRNVPDEQLPGHPRGTAMHAARGAVSRTGSSSNVDTSASIDAMLKADAVSVEDCMEALQTTKPASSVSQHGRYASSLIFAVAPFAPGCCHWILIYWFYADMSNGKRSLDRFNSCDVKSY